MAPKRTGSTRTHIPSEIFAMRLRETRRARGRTQTELAEAMTNAGRPLNRPAVIRIESGERGISLDEAIGLASVLNAAPALMLSPPGDDMVALTDNTAVDGEALRDWLATGSALLTWPSHAPGTPEDALREEALLESRLVSLATALLDAARTNDGPAKRVVLRMIGEVVLAHERALEKGDANAS